MADVLVIGGGLAGWRAAEAAARAGRSVALVANGAGNSPHIHALNAPVLPEDSVELHIADTMRSGHGKNDPELVRTLCEGAAELPQEFDFDRLQDGSYRLLQPLGCSVPRCVMIGPAVGAHVLAQIKRELGGVAREGRAAALLLDGRRVCGVRLTDGTELAAHAVVLATGGWCGRYDFSTNPPELQGDGIEMARVAGAAVRDLDLVQYEPTAALEPAALRTIPVITTLLHEGATFRNKDGREFLADRHAGKDVLSEAIRAEIARGNGVRGGVWYDATGVPREVLESRYAPLVARYAAQGVDITREPMLVAPAPHTSLGGVVIDSACRVEAADGSGPVPGLFAAGEVTGGVHGANRLGGNAGTEVLVFGRIAGRSAAACA